MTSIKVAEGNTTYKSEDGLLLSADGTKLLRCPDGKKGTLTLPASVTELKNSYLEHCQQLTSITVAAGNTVYTSKGGLLLSGDGTQLLRSPGGKSGSLTLPASLPAKFDFSPFGECANLTEFSVAKGSQNFNSTQGMVSSHKTNTFACDLYPIHRCPVGKAGAFTFSTSGDLYNIADGAFAGCEKLTAITFSGNAGERAFEGCTNLKSVTLASPQTNCFGTANIRIGKYAFRNTAIESVTLRADICEIAAGAFSNCPSLKSFDAGQSPFRTAAEGALLLSSDGKTVLACAGGTQGAVTVPEGVSRIEESAFAGCAGVTSITLPEGLKTVGDDAFEGCSSLRTVQLPSTLESLPNAAFSGCSSLTRVMLPEAGAFGLFDGWTDFGSIPFEVLCQTPPSAATVDGGKNGAGVR